MKKWLPLLGRVISMTGTKASLEPRASQLEQEEILSESVVYSGCQQMQFIILLNIFTEHRYFKWGDEKISTVLIGKKNKNMKNKIQLIPIIYVIANINIL